MALFPPWCSYPHTQIPLFMDSMKARHKVCRACHREVDYTYSTNKGAKSNVDKSRYYGKSSSSSSSSD